MRVLGGEGALMDPNRRLGDVYIFVLQVSWSHSLCTLTGPRQNAFIRASWNSPWERTVCQHRETPHCWAHSPPRKAQEESNSHTSRASPTGLGSGQTLKAQHCPKKEKLSQICFLWDYHLMASSRGNKTISVFVHHLTHQLALLLCSGQLCKPSRVSFSACRMLIELLFPPQVCRESEEQCWESAKSLRNPYLQDPDGPEEPHVSKRWLIWCGASSVRLSRLHFHLNLLKQPNYTT